MPTLAAARDAVARGDHRAALIALLVAWRTCTDRELARAIDAVSARAAATVPRPAAWTARAANDPVVMHHVLVMFDECEPEERIPRMLALGAYDDPRVAARLVAAMIAGVPTRRFPAFKQAIAVLETLRDPRIVDQADALAAAYPDAGPRRAMAAACKRIRAAHDAEQRLTAENRALVTAIADAAAPAPPAAGGDATEAALLAAVYAAPQDDGPREIYADWLLQRGDPRGEFIMLQLKRARDSVTDQERKRIRALAEAHGARWAGPAGERGNFGRGFLYAVEGLSYRDPDDPSYATITSSSQGMPPRSAWPALDTVLSASAEDMALLPELPAASPLRLLSWEIPNDKKPLDAKAIAAYRRAKLPALDYLGVTRDGAFDRKDFGPDDPRWRPDTIAWMFESRTLGSLQFPGHPKHLAAYLALLEPTTIKSVGLHMFSPSIDVVRDAATGPFTQLELKLTPPFSEAVVDLVAGVIAKLPPSLTKISIASSHGGLARLLARTKKKLAAAAAHHPGCVVEP